jgi:hypothetical protein
MDNEEVFQTIPNIAGYSLGIPDLFVPAGTEALVGTAVVSVSGMVSCRRSYATTTCYY